MNLKEIIIEEAREEFDEKFPEKSDIKLNRRDWLRSVKSHQNSLLIKIFEAEVEKMKEVLDKHIAEAERSYKSAVSDQVAPYRHQLERLLEIRDTLIKEYEELIAWLREKS